MSFSNLYQRNMGKAIAGLAVGQPGKVVSGVNEAAALNVTVTIDNVISLTNYAFNVNGYTVSFVSDATATDVEIRDGLIAALEAHTYLKDDFSAAADTSSTLIVSSNFKAIDAVLTEGDPNLSIVTNQASGVTLRPGTFARVSGFSGDNLQLARCASGLGVAGALVHSQSHMVDRPRDHHISESAGATDRSGIQPGQCAGLMKQGSLWMIAETAFAPGDSLFYRVASSGAGSTFGAVRNADDGANTDQLTSGYSILQYDSAAGLVLVSLNLS